MAGRARIAAATLLLALPQLLHAVAAAAVCAAAATEAEDDVGLLALPQLKPDATHITAALQVLEKEREKQGASSTPDPCGAFRVAIFDIDNTLTVATDHDERVCPVLRDYPAPSWPANGSGTTQAVVDAIQAARDSGYKLAVASAESYNQQYNPKQREFLQRLFGQDKILGTPAEQSAYSLWAPSEANKDVAINASTGGALGLKEPMITNIMKHYCVSPDCWYRSVLLDDQVENDAAAHALGLRTIRSSPECGGFYCDWGCGISPQSASILKKLATDPRGF